MYSYSRFYFVLFFLPSSLLSIGYSFNVEMSEFRKVWREKQHNYYSIELNGEHFSGTRPWHVRWEKIKLAVDFTGKRVLDIGTSVGLCPLFLSMLTSAQKIVAFDNESDAVYNADRLMKVFNTNYELFKIDLERDPYEQILGYEYDIVICMSVFNWIGKKQKLLNYLKHFNELIFEGHEGVQTEIDRLRALGFKHIQVLGAVDRDRHLLYCSK